uniref:Allophycocyanin beta 18 subunit n=1 Tax=Ophidocladus simpliciusculus TaxID=1261574 RepID=A0A1Z1MIQ9_9FLOR|nr:allophycocyanin beta 18 subunit [Ophidocladus simpliciusculus]ARW65960.1 allophycocyanin beta 18 subunit [Ophidocladus simpliciusculus]
MQDTITNILNQYDTIGQYLDNKAINEINKYFQRGIDIVEAIEIITSRASKIVKETATRLYSEQPELLRPGGNSYTTRRYATCLRDIDYYLRYTSYALIAGNINILNERLLNGLKETYLSLDVPIGPTISSIQILKEVVISEISNKKNINEYKEIFVAPFDYISRSLSEQNI